DYFAAAVDAIAAGVIFRIAGAAGGAVDGDQSFCGFDRQCGGESALAESGDHHVAGDFGFGSRYGLRPGALQPGLHEAHGLGAAVFLEDAGGLGEPVEADAFDLRVIVLEGEGRHLFFRASVEDVDVRRAHADGGVGGVDGGVAGADDDHGFAYLKIGLRFVALDEAERVDDAGELIAGDAEALHGAEADADEDEVEV